MRKVWVEVGLDASGSAPVETAWVGYESDENGGLRRGDSRNFDLFLWQCIAAAWNILFQL